MSEQQLTPQSIATTSFADKAQEYNDLLAKKTELNKTIAESELSLRKLLRQNGVEVSWSGDLLGLEDKLKVFLPLPEPEEKEGLVYVAAKAEGRAFSEIVSNPPLMKKLEKKLGAEAISFFREVDDVFHQREKKLDPELDETKTKELKDQYEDLCGKLVQAKIELTAVESQEKNVKEFIAFCKELGTLAGKPQGKDQGQQQKQN